MRLQKNQRRDAEYFSVDGIDLPSNEVRTGTPSTGTLKTFDPVNTRYWPYYHYTFPYQHTEGGAWPPGMYSRFYNWQPGYDTAGWSYWMRPGMSYNRWPRNRWIQKLGDHYTINNGTDRSKDYL